MKRLKIYNVICLITLLVVVISGCKKTKDDTLSLPSEESMDMNFDFTSKTKSASETMSTTHHDQASAGIFVWTAIAAFHTVIPVAAFKEALNQKPVFDDADKLWEWKYSVTIASATYQAKLTGKISEDSVQWKMYLTKVGDTKLSNFLWFEGKSHEGRTGGWWLLYYPRTDNINDVFISEVGLYIKWAITSDKDKWLQYIYAADTVPKVDNNVTTYVANDNKGGYIKFGLQDDPTFDAYYDIYSAKENKLWEILWNISSKEGQIKLTSDNVTTIVGCWDSSFNDKTTCN